MSWGNFSLVVNSKFQPFSFERYIQPYQMYGEAYKEVENALGELATKASVWEEMANEQTDPYAYKMYKTYANDLEEKAGQLAREGLNAASRRDMLNMRARYSKEITPIENAYKKREEDIARQKKVADATGGRTVFTRDARTTSLDKYMEGIDDYGQTNLDELYKEGAAGGAAISKRYLSTREGQLFNGMYLNLQRTTGMTNDQIQQFLSNQKDAKGNLLFPELHALKNELLSKSNYQNYSVADQNRMEQAILSGINTGIVYNVEDKPMENWRDKMAAQEAMQIRAEKRAVRRAAEREAESNRYRINPLPLRSEQETDASNKKLQGYINKGYLKRTKAGLTLTQKGLSVLRGVNGTPIVQSWESYKKQHPGATRSSYDTMVAESRRIASRPNVFYEWYNKNVGGFNAQTGKVSTPTTRLNAYEQSIKQGSYDVYHSTEYDRQLDNTYGKEYTKQAWGAAPSKDGEKYLQGVEFNGKNGWVNTKKYTKKDLEGYYISNVRYSKWGDTAYLQSDEEGKNEVIRIRLPKGIHVGVETNIRNAISNADYWGSILHKNRRPMIDRSGNIATDTKGNIIYSNSPLTEADKIDLKKKQEDALQDLYGYGSQAVVPSQTSDETISPWY